VLPVRAPAPPSPRSAPILLLVLAVNITGVTAQLWRSGGQRPRARSSPYALESIRPTGAAPARTGTISGSFQQQRSAQHGLELDRHVAGRSIFRCGSCPLSPVPHPPGRSEAAGPVQARGRRPLLRGRHGTRACAACRDERCARGGTLLFAAAPRHAHRQGANAFIIRCRSLAAPAPPHALRVWLLLLASTDSIRVSRPSAAPCHTLWMGEHRDRHSVFTLVRFSGTLVNSVPRNR
jgi:hypothetical protein